MRYGYSQYVGPVAVLLLPLLAFSQDKPLPKKQTPKENTPKPRLDFYGDPLPEGAEARMGTVRYRLPDDAMAVALSPDGRRVAVRCDRESRSAILMIDSDTGKHLGYLGDTLPNLIGLPAFSPDGKTLASLTRSNGILLWDLVAGKSREVPGDTVFDPHWAVFSSDLKKLAVLGVTPDQESKLVLRDVDSGERLVEFAGHVEDAMYPFGYSEDGNVLISASDEAFIRIWNTETGKERRRLIVPRPLKEGKPDPNVTALSVWRVALSPDGKTVAALVYVHRDDTEFTTIHVVLLDVVSGQVVRTLHSGGEGESLYFDWVTFSPDGTRLLMSGSHICSWDIRTGKRIFQAHQKGDYAVYSRDGKRILVTGGFLAHLLDASTGKRVSDMDVLDHWVVALAFTSDGRKVVTGGWDGTVRVWDAATGRQLRRLGKSPESHRGESVDHLHVSPSGRYVVAVDEENRRTRVWDCEKADAVLDVQGVPLTARYESYWEREDSEKAEKEKESHREGVSAIAFSRDDRYLALGANDGTIRLWNLRFGGPESSLPLHKGGVAALSFSEDAERLYSWGLDWTLREIDISTSREIRSIEMHKGEEVILGQFSLDSRWLACGDSTGRLHLWEVATGEERLETKAYDSRFSLLRFSADGRRLLTRGTMNAKRVRENFQALREGRPPPHMEIDVLCKVWDPEIGGEVLALTGKNRGNNWSQEEVFRILSWRQRGSLLPTVATLSPDGRTVATEGGPGAVRIWEVATGKMIRSFGADATHAYTLAFSPRGEIVAANSDNTTLLWRVFPRRSIQTSRDGSKGPPDLRDLWKDLAKGDAKRAYEAIGGFGDGKDRAVGFIEERLRPAPIEIPDRLRVWIANLDEEEYEVRERASERISRMGSAALPALRDALAKGSTVEARVRMKILIDRITLPFEEFPSETLRTIRAIQTVERIGTEKAKAFLGRLARGHHLARRTREAKAALKRLESRSSK
ncbi:MAG: WD40 repeat domain-containing protein [Planctomycetota bacterium]|nr:WD40 repeat domain-containing protein [Planctomycetota bacterium]